MQKQMTDPPGSTNWSPTLPSPGTWAAPFSTWGPRSCCARN